MSEMNQTWIFARRPPGEISQDIFTLDSTPVPDPGAGEVLIRTRYVSVDPYMRNRMNNVPSYIAPYRTGFPMEGDIVGEVIASGVPEYKGGEYVTGMLPWSEYVVAQTSRLTRIPDAGEAQHWLGVYGLTGLTAYFGMAEIGKPAKGETVVVSGAAGAVGSIAGQIARIFGASVTGIAGSEEKVSFITSTLGFDSGINYKTVRNIRKELVRTCPEGVDVYFDNVGGEISDAVLYRINDFARIVLCGQISQYNNTRIATGPRLNALLLIHRALMQGFIVYDYLDRFAEAREKLRQWVAGGKLIAPMCVVDGFENLPGALISLFAGKNTGKMIVKV